MFCQEGPAGSPGLAPSHGEIGIPEMFCYYITASSNETGPIQVRSRRYRPNHAGDGSLPCRSDPCPSADLPIIICTRSSYVVDAEVAQAAGLKGSTMKPLTKREIARIVRKVLDRWAGQRLSEDDR